jgi:hypothetical protein
MAVHRVSAYGAVMSRNTSSCLIRILYLTATMSEVCAPDKDVTFFGEKFCFRNVPGFSTGR